MDDYGEPLQYGPADYAKTPDESIRIEFPWAAKLNGETVSSVTYELPDGLTNAAETGSGSLRYIRISGGAEGHVYRVIGKAVTSGSRTLEVVRRVLVREG